jgi:hypothetical protein
VQKPYPQILLGGFSPNTFTRIVKYADGWIPVAGFGPLEQLEQGINGLMEGVRKANNRDPSKIRVYVLSHLNVQESPPPPGQQRSPMSGTIDQIGSDIEQVKAMEGVEQIIISHTFSPVGRDAKNMIEVTKQLARFAK